MAAFPELPDPGALDSWGAELNDAIEARTVYTVDEIERILRHLGLSITSGPNADIPVGTGREDLFNTSITASASNYTQRGQLMVAKTSFWLSGVRMYTGGGGVMTASILNLDGKALATGTVNTASALVTTPAWFTVTFENPIYLTAGTNFIFGMIPTTATKTWRRVTSTYDGTLWSSVRSTTNGLTWFDSPTFAGEINAVGLVEYLS